MWMLRRITWGTRAQYKRIPGQTLTDRSSTFYLLRLLPCPGSLHAQDIRQSYAVSLLCSLHLIHRKCSSSFASAKSENGVTPRPQPLVWCHRLLHPDFCSLDSSGRTRTPAHLYPPWKINMFNPPSNQVIGWQPYSLGFCLGGSALFPFPSVARAHSSH